MSEVESWEGQLMELASQGGELVVKIGGQVVKVVVELKGGNHEEEAVDTGSDRVLNRP